MRKALSFEFFIASDFIVGIACGFLFARRFEHSDVASSVAYLMLEAVGIVSTVLSLRSAGIVYGDAEVGHSFCVRLCIFAWFMFLAGLIGSFLWADDLSNQGKPWSYFTYGFILLSISMIVGVRGRGVFLIFAALSATRLVEPTLRHGHASVSHVHVPHGTIKCAMGILVSHAIRYLCHQRLAFCIVAQPIIAAFIGQAFFAFPRWGIVGLLFFS